MNRSMVAGILTVGLLGGAAWLATRHESPGGEPPLPASAAGQRALALDTAASCRECHPAVYDEWLASRHAFAYVNPLTRREDMADGFRKKDCIPCHAPRPVFEYGLGKSARVLARDTNRADGVDCLSCHRVRDGVATSRAGLSGACNPLHAPEVVTTDLCAPCHNQHNTVDEWEASTKELRGENCNGCHMPPVQRAATALIPAHTGRSHKSLGGNDPNLLATTAKVETAIKDAPAATAGNGEERVTAGKILVVTLTNVGCAHNLPTDARHRAVDLVVHLRGPSGTEIGPIVNLGAGEEGGVARFRMRNPYRDEFGKVNTELASGASTTLEIPFDPGTAREAEVEVLYKRTPFVSDKDAAVILRTSVALNAP